MIQCACRARVTKDRSVALFSQKFRIYSLIIIGIYTAAGFSSSLRHVYQGGGRGIAKAHS